MTENQTSTQPTLTNSQHNFKPVLKLKQVCEILGVSLSTGRRLLDKNAIEYFKVGAQVRITQVALTNYIEAQGVDAAE